MYSHCLFCNAALGANESIEAFQVGRRLAFDAAKGRLWVVCPACHRWNLTPFESRWEAIEECERLYREQRLRAQTDNIGMAKTREGTELVRIGPAPRLEFAAWRYGREFNRRYRRHAAYMVGGSTIVAAGSLLGSVPGVVAAITTAAPFLAISGYLAMMVGLGGLQRWKSTRVVGESGKVLRVTRLDLERTYLTGEGPDPFRLDLRHSMGRETITGERARRAMGAILARVNSWGAPTKDVAGATSFLADAGAPERAAERIAAESRRLAGDFEEDWKYSQKFPHKPPRGQRNPLLAGTVMNRGALPRLPAEQRLALEMALHEESERTAMEGELALLEARWREAEEIAAIADGELTTIPRSSE